MCTITSMSLALPQLLHMCKITHIDSVREVPMEDTTTSLRSYQSVDNRDGVV